MTRILLVLLLLMPVKSLATIDYQLSVKLSPDEQLLQATALITLDKSLAGQLDLQLSDTCEIVAICQAGKVLPYSFAEGTLSIKLDDRQPVSISYRDYFSDQPNATPIHNEDPGYGIFASISSAGTYLSSAANWYPQLATEAIHYRIEVTSPPGIEAVTSGQRIERGNFTDYNYSVWQIDYPLSGITLSAGPYQVFEDRDGKVPIYAYFYADSAALAATYLQQARGYLRLYEELFGPYPFHKFAIVENFFPTGYGLPSWTLLGSSVIRLPFIVKTSLGHEIAHSWWGTGVKVDYERGNWAEGLTTYVADHLYQERASNKNAIDYRLKILRDYASLVGSDNRLTLTGFRSRHDKASQSIGYGKAAMLFHMLRKQLGDELFWAGLKQMAQTSMFQCIGWDDFAEYFSGVTGRDLQPFFEQWITRPEGPKLVLQNVKVTQIADGYSVSGELAQSTPHYRLTVDLQVDTEKESILLPIELEGRSQPFNLHLPAKPTVLRADPAADLFRILAPEEIPPTVNAIRGSQNLLILRTANKSPSEETMTSLLGALRKDLEVETLSDMTDAELSQHDLLIFGVSDRLQPSMSAGEAGKLSGPTESTAGTTEFIVLPNPLNANRVAAWFIDDGNELAAVVARKIPHYGKFSYLQFKGADNRKKSILPSLRSPLKIEF